MIGTKANLADLYEADETAWLEAMAELIGHGEYSQLDYEHLREYLTDMATRDRKEVRSRLIQLIAHVLKWVHQPNRRSRSWMLTIIKQQDGLEFDLRSRILRRFAEEVLPEAYKKAVKQASAQTGLSEKKFPATCPYTLDQLLAFDPKESDDETESE